MLKAAILKVSKLPKKSVPPSLSALSLELLHALILVAAAREAGDADFDVLIACAFNYEAHATEFSKLGRIPVLKARMNADLHMAEDSRIQAKAISLSSLASLIFPSSRERRQDSGKGERCGCL